MATPSIKEDIGALKAGQAMADEHRRAMSDKMDLLLDRTAPIPTALANISEKLDRSAKEAEALDNRVSALETKQTAIEAKLGFVRWMVGIGATLLAAVGIKFTFHS